MASDISINPPDGSAESEKPRPLRSSPGTPPRKRRSEADVPPAPSQAATPRKRPARQSSSARPEPTAEPPASPQPPAPPATAPSASQDVAAETPAPGEPIVGHTVSRMPAFAMSTLLHVVVLLVLALIVREPPSLEPPRLITAPPSERIEKFVEEFEILKADVPDVEVLEIVESVVVPDTVTTVAEVNVESLADDLDAAPLAVELTDFSLDAPSANDFMQQIGVAGGEAGGLGGRSGRERERLLLEGGGTKESDEAVLSGCEWIAAHQWPDGGWSCDLTLCPSCKGACSHSGTGAVFVNPDGTLREGRADRSAATALALLPLLGTGNTHLKDGKFRNTVSGGLGYLTQQVQQGKGKAYPPGGSLYTQGLVGIVLSEAFQMTGDPSLREPAQLALNYIMESQDPAGGGWRYAPRNAGDTSVVGWQLMALKSGFMANLQVSPLTVKKAEYFLDSVQLDEGSRYRYSFDSSLEEKRPACDAAGLLCRMYMGWKKDHPSLQKGIKLLAERGPTNDLYYDYYATQVMRHHGGEPWETWNAKMRDFIVKAQIHEGHEKGSWFTGLEGGHGANEAGRLYTTSMATMILEVYYRHLPLYGKKEGKEGADPLSEFEE